MSAPKPRVSVAWHTYGQSRTRREWLTMPDAMYPPAVSALSAWISAHLREREGLPERRGYPEERDLWFEWDAIRYWTDEQLEERGDAFWGRPPQAEP